MALINKRRNLVVIAIYLLLLFVLHILLYLDDYIVYQKTYLLLASLFLALLVFAVFCTLFITIFKMAPKNIFLAVVLTIPIWLIFAIRYYNNYGEQQGVSVINLENKGYLYGRHYIIKGFLDPSCHERIYYLPRGRVFLEFVAQLRGCYDDIDISEIRLSEQLIVLSIKSSYDWPKLLVRSTNGKWREFRMPADYKGYESHAKQIDMFFEGFDYNADSNVIDKYSLSPDGREFKFVSKTLLDTPGCKEIKQIFEIFKSGDGLTRYDTVMQIKLMGGPCAEKYLWGFAYSANEDVEVKQLAEQALAEIRINKEYMENEMRASKKETVGGRMRLPLVGIP